MGHPKREKGMQGSLNLLFHDNYLIYSDFS